MTSLQLPRSATSFPLALAALFAGLVVAWAIAPSHHLGLERFVPYQPLLPCIAVVLVIAAGEWAFPGLAYRSAYAIGGGARRAADLRRVLTRLCGLIATLALIALVYWLFPEYAGSFYAPYWEFLRTVAPLTLLVPVYFVWADTRLEDPQDDYLAFGQLVLGGWRDARWSLVRNHLLAWTIKGFFLPLMVVYLGDEMRAFHHGVEGLERGSLSTYDLCYHLSYAADLLFCVVGYSAATRLFDSQIRSVEPTVAGWLVALVCYQPFYSVIGKYYLQYDDTIFWDNWLAPLPWLRDAWGVAIIALTCTYALCTVAFGLRFSNLTYRGIITSGPYRFSKHPAYLAKNLSWWLISVPFVSDQGWQTGLRNCCLLALLNLIYFARARTEERHLSRDPDYVAYALWINEHGLLRHAGRLLPFLKYRAPAGGP